MDNKETVFNEVSSASLKGWPSFTILVSSIVIQILGLTFGAQLFWMTSFKNFVLSIVIADLVLFFVLCLSGNIGRIKRIPTSVLYGNMFGRLGARILTALLLPTGIVWIAWMTEIASKSLLGLFPAADFKLIAGLIILGSVLSSIKGIKGMEFSSYIQLPVVIIFIAIGCIGIYKGNGGTFNLFINSNYSLNLFQGIVFTVLTWITFIPFYSDYTRFIRTKKDMYISTGLSWILINTLVMICGGIFASYAGNNFDLIKVFESVGIPRFLPVIIILLCTWTFNDRSLYSFGISINIVLGNEKYKRLMMILGGMLASLLVFIGVQSKILEVLNYMGAIFSPLLGMFLCEYYLMGGNKSGFSKFDKMPYIKGHAFIPWLIGAVLALMVKEFQPALSMAISIAAYFIVKRVFREKVSNVII